MPGTRRPTPKRADLYAVEAFLRRGRRLRLGALAAALVIVLLLIVLDHLSGGLLSVGDDMQRYDGQTFAVARVIDGDTLDLRVPDGEHRTTRIRLWGVDTPELASRDGEKDAEPLAREAAGFVRELLEGRSVTLHLEPGRRRGRYGRLLAYVELEDGTLLNARLIEAGLSPADDRWSHSRLEAFEQLEAEAKRRGLGLWARE